MHFDSPFYSLDKYCNMSTVLQAIILLIPNLTRLCEYDLLKFPPLLVFPNAVLARPAM
jgi:hypothetical protein